MTRLIVDPRQPSAEGIERAAEVIRAGGIVAYPTDTLYGLAVDPRDLRAVGRLFHLKGRPDSRAIPLVAADRLAAARTGHFTRLTHALAERFWPGPLTVLVRADDSLAPAIHAGTGLAAVRVPDSIVARELARAAGGLITATSANRSGAPATADPRKVEDLAGSGLDLLLDAGAAPGGPPSTIVNLTAEPPLLVRAGAVPWERVLEFLDAAAQ